MTWKGAGGSEIVSQSRQVNFSRTVCRTNQRRGTTSRVSVTASPILASRLPPQQRQVVGRRNHEPLARQMLRQRAAGGPLPDMRRHDRAGFRLGGFGRRLVLGRGLLELGQLQLELVDEPLAALAGLSELLAPRLGQQQPQALDLEPGAGHQGFGVARPDLGLEPGGALGQDHGVRRGEIGGKGCGLVPHGLDASTSHGNS